jgi:pimeloyl-ACP methyl ester carboxylesterase
VFCPDLKGFGENLGMEYPYSLGDYVNEVGEYLYKNGIKKPHVIAHSFGGRIVLKGVSENVLDFDKIVLAGSAGLKPKFSLKKAVKKGVFSVAKRVFPKEKLKSFYSSDYLSLSPVMRESFIKIVNEHLDGSLKKVKNPALIVFGAEDRETPVYMAKRLNEGIENSTLLLIEGAGHFCFVEKPLKFNMEVREFLLS